VGGLTDTLTERDVEVGFAETGNRRKIRVTDRGVHVRVDVSQNAPYLPGRKARRRDAGRRRRRLFQILQQRFRALQALRGPVPFIAQGLVERAEYLGDGGAQLPQGDCTSRIADQIKFRGEGRGARLHR